MSIFEIVRQYLKDKGYDGLCNHSIGDDVCGCSLDDLFPCDEPHCGDCLPAYKHTDGMMYLEKEAQDERDEREDS